LNEQLNLVIDGHSLTLAVLENVASGNNEKLAITEAGRERMICSRGVVLEALKKGDAVYGLTTGLGSQSTAALAESAVADFSMQTLTGRAQSIGSPLPVEVVRGAMLVRLNTLLTGGAGADPKVADCLLACLNQNITPVVGNIGSTGVADLCWGATMGLALTGAGQMIDRGGNVSDADVALNAVGIEPLVLGPKDGLCIASHSGFVGAMLGLTTQASSVLLGAIQSTTAMTMEAMRANLTPLDPVAAELHPQQKQAEAATTLRMLLTGSKLFLAGESARLQDPLSIRNAVHVHAAALAAIDSVRVIATAEVNSVTDNPLVDLEQNRILSCGSYYTAHLAIAAQSLSHALSHVATAQLARLSKLLSARFSALPQFLASGGSHSNGFAPVMKIAEALVAKIQHDAMPVAVWPSVNAEGVEDIQSNSPLVAQSLQRVIESCRQLCAIELVVSAQALDMLPEVAKAERVKDLISIVRNYSEYVQSDRSISADIMSISDAIARGEFAPSVR